VGEMTEKKGIKELNIEERKLKVWAKKVYEEHPDIIDHMLKSHDCLERVIAKRIKILAQS
jgi:hypothetical protein